MKQLKEAGARLEIGARVMGVTDRGVKINKEGATEFIEADTVVIARGLVPNTELAGILSGKGPDIYTVGDFAEPGRLLEATASGFLTGQQI